MMRDSRGKTPADSGRKADATPAGTAAGRQTTAVDDPAKAVDVQLEQGKKARRDAESEQVDTDCYNTSGNDANPPKTPASHSGDRGATDAASGTPPTKNEDT